MVKNGIWENGSAISFATINQISLFSVGVASSIYVLAFPVWVRAGVSLPRGTVLEFATQNVAGFDFILQTGLVMTPSQNCTASSSSKPATIATIWPLPGIICRLFVSNFVDHSVNKCRAEHRLGYKISHAFNYCVCFVSVDFNKWTSDTFGSRCSVTDGFCT